VLGCLAEKRNQLKSQHEGKSANYDLPRTVGDEIGVDLMKRSPRGVTLTAEGKLFLDEVRELLECAVEKVRDAAISQGLAALEKTSQLK